MAIQLCYDDRSYIDFVFESSGLRLTSLTNGGIHHKYYVVRILEREKEREREREEEEEEEEKESKQSQAVLWGNRNSLKVLCNKQCLRLIVTT